MRKAFSWTCGYTFITNTMFRRKQTRGGWQCSSHQGSPCAEYLVCYQRFMIERKDTDSQGRGGAGSGKGADDRRNFLSHTPLDCNGATNVQGLSSKNVAKLGRRDLTQGPRRWRSIAHRLVNSSEKNTTWHLVREACRKYIMA